MDWKTTGSYATKTVEALDQGGEYLRESGLATKEKVALKVTATWTITTTDEDGNVLEESSIEKTMLVNLKIPKAAGLI